MGQKAEIWGQDSVLQKWTAAPSVSSPVQGDAGYFRRPQSQRTSSLQMLSVRSGQELGEGLGARRAKIRKVSWRRQHRFMLKDKNST